MDSTAIQTIQNTAIEAAGSNRLGTDTPTIILRGDQRVESLEQFDEHRSRFRGRLATTVASEFINYVLRRDSKQKPNVFIDGDKLVAQAYFNLGDEHTPGHCDDLASLTLKPTAAFSAAVAATQRPLSQREVVDFLEDWRENITPAMSDEDGGGDGLHDTISVAAAIARVRRISIKATSERESEEKNFSGRRTQIEQIEARAAGAEPPSAFYFACEPYLGLPERVFQLRLSIRTSGEEPSLVLRIARLEAQKEAMAQDFRLSLARELGERAIITIGSFTP